MENTYFNIPETFDYSKYEQQPIHIPGYIQAHGVLIALQEPDLTILQISENTKQFFGIPAESLLGQNLNCLLSSEQIQLIINSLQENQPEFIHSLEIPTCNQKKSSPLLGIPHRANGVLILELEPHAAIKTNPLLGYTHLLERAVFNIRNASHLSDLYQIIAQEVRLITQFDRVMIYRFADDYSGVVIAEDKQTHLENYLGLYQFNMKLHRKELLE